MDDKFKNRNLELAAVAAWAVLAAAVISAAISLWQPPLRVAATSVHPGMLELSNTWTGSNAWSGSATFGALTATSINGLTGPPTPATAGGTNVGSAALPFANVYVGASATDNIKITGTATGARTFTLPDASITASGLVATDCGTDATCATPTVYAAPYAITGCPSFSSSATLAVTGLTFPNAVTSVQVTEQSNTGVTFKVSSVSTSGFTITASGSNSDKVCFTAIGN